MRDFKKVLVAFGTRPEAIKLAPVIRALGQDDRFEVYTCSTGQHREMVRPVCDFFDIPVDHDLDVMRPGQSLDHIATTILRRMPSVLEEVRPDLVVVQGDTATAFSAALAAFFARVKIAHVEAGLRTYDLSSPWPEEGFRAMVGRIADFNFAPTERAHRNLVNECAQGEIVVTGNTVVDAALTAAEKLDGLPSIKLALRLGISATDRKKILFTMHRRESFGEPVERVLSALNDIALKNDVEVLFPVHPNPNICEPARRILGANPNVRLLQPLSYDELVFVLRTSTILVTDSGGLAEEAPTFRKPTLVLRETTERPECIECGTAKLVGTDAERLAQLVAELLSGGCLYETMAAAPNPFGDGRAAERIVNYLAEPADVLAAAA